MSMRDHILTWANKQAARGNPVSIQEIAEHVDGIFRRQAAAAKQGMNAAKEHGAHMESEAKRLHAECNPEALDSERAANAQLTEELETALARLAPLAELGRQIATQDNRMTDQPMFVVFQKREIVAAEGYGEDRVVWVDEEGNEASEDMVARLDALRADHESDHWLEDEIEQDGSEWRRLAVKEIDEFVTACFTEQGCKEFLEIQGHNLCRPFIYAAGSFRNREFQQLRTLMLELAKEDA